MYDELKRLREIAEAATPGPWEFERVSWDDGDFSFERNTPGQGFISIREDDFDEKGQRSYARKDARFIATFNPTLVLGLLDKLETAVEALEQRCTHTFFCEPPETPDEDGYYECPACEALAKIKVEK